MSGTVQDFLNQLEDDIRRSREHGRQRNGQVKWLYIGAVTGSALGTFLGLFEQVPKEAIAIVSAVPAVAMLAIKTLALDTQATWYWQRVGAYVPLQRAIRYEALPVDQASKRLKEIDNALGPRPNPGLYPAPEQRSPS
jgi:hypothetical protein